MWRGIILYSTMKWVLATVLTLGIMTLAFYLGYATVCDSIRSWLMQTPSMVPLMVAAIYLGQFVTGMQTPPDPCSYVVGWSFFPVYAIVVVCAVAGTKRYGRRMSSGLLGLFGLLELLRRMNRKR